MAKGWYESKPEYIKSKGLFDKHYKFYKRGEDFEWWPFGGGVAWKNGGGTLADYLKLATEQEYLTFKSKQL